MAGFSDKLRQARNSRNTPLEEVAERTQIGIQYLEALERGDLDGLPGRRGFGKLYIRVYAELFGFDPDPVIAEYEKERLKLELEEEANPRLRSERRSRARFVPPPRDPQLTEPATREPASKGPSLPQAGASLNEEAPSWKSWIAGGAVILVALGALGVALMVLASRPTEPALPEPPATTGSETPSAAVIGEDDAGQKNAMASPPVRDDPSLATTPPIVATPPVADPQPLDVSAFELGTGVANRQVVDARRDFEEGTVASFLTRVRGGIPGQTIHHAWIREGQVIQRIELTLGGANWRTYSHKTLWGTGNWAVEARDQDGRVLARAEFRCSPSLDVAQRDGRR